VEVGHHHHPEGIKEIEIDFGCGDDGGSSSDCRDGDKKEGMIDEDTDLTLHQDEETCHVYEEDERGKKVKNPAKTYKISPVETFVGIKINLDDRYYDEKASAAYQKRAKKLMKYTSHIEEVVCLHSHDEVEEDGQPDMKNSFAD